VFILAHLGITLATVKVGTVISDKLRAVTVAGESRKSKANLDDHEAGKLSPTSPVDYRFLLLGAILPDLIDKPLGMVLLGEQIGNGHIFTHTLLFALVLLHGGVILSGQGRRMLLSLFVGVFFHLVLDKMWFEPHVLLWPLYGWAFPKETPMSILEFVKSVLQGWISTPAVVGSEAIGGMLLLAAMLGLISRRRLRRFAKVGDL